MIVRLGAAGVVRSIVVDTAHFTGNYPQACSVDACSASGYPLTAGTGRRGRLRRGGGVVPRGLLTGDARHAFRVSSARRFTHVRLNIFPDGGVARLHVHGEVVPDPALLEGLTFDLAALENGADIVGPQRPVLLLAAQRHLPRAIPGDGRGLGDPQAAQAGL